MTYWTATHFLVAPVTIRNEEPDRSALVPGAPFLLGLAPVACAKHDETALFIDPNADACLNRQSVTLQDITDDVCIIRADELQWLEEATILGHPQVSIPARQVRDAAWVSPSGTGTAYIKSSRGDRRSHRHPQRRHDR